MLLANSWNPYYAVIRSPVPRLGEGLGVRADGASCFVKKYFANSIHFVNAPYKISDRTLIQIRDLRFTFRVKKVRASRIQLVQVKPITTPDSPSLNYQFSITICLMIALPFMCNRAHNSCYIKRIFLENLIDHLFFVSPLHIQLQRKDLDFTFSLLQISTPCGIFSRRPVHILHYWINISCRVLCIKSHCFRQPQVITFDLQSHPLEVV